MQIYYGVTCAWNAQTGSDHVVSDFVGLDLDGTTLAGLTTGRLFESRLDDVSVVDLGSAGTFPSADFGLSVWTALEATDVVG